MIIFPGGRIRSPPERRRPQEERGDSRRNPTRSGHRKCQAARRARYNVHDGPINETEEDRDH